MGAVTSRIAERLSGPRRVDLTSGAARFGYGGAVKRRALVAFCSAALAAVAAVVVSGCSHDAADAGAGAGGGMKMPVEAVTPDRGADRGRQRLPGAARLAPAGGHLPAGQRRGHRHPRQAGANGEGGRAAAADRSAARVGQPVEPGRRQGAARGQPRPRQAQRAALRRALPRRARQSPAARGRPEPGAGRRRRGERAGSGHRRAVGAARLLPHRRPLRGHGRRHPGEAGRLRRPADQAHQRRRQHHARGLRQHPLRAAPPDQRRPPASCCWGATRPPTPPWPRRR